MRILLDTHGFLWSLFDPGKLSEKASNAILSPENDVAVSTVTFWEISLKYALGKLELTGVEPEQLPEYADKMDMEILSLSAIEAASFHRLPRLAHKDPFDRIIIWQAISQKRVLVSKDRDFKAYQPFGLAAIW
jgi:PIN domain nuclease of toxin-antitoxin system